MKTQQSCLNGERGNAKLSICQAVLFWTFAAQVLQKSQSLTEYTAGWAGRYLKFALKLHDLKIVIGKGQCHKRPVQRSAAGRTERLRLSASAFWPWAHDAANQAIGILQRTTAWQCAGTLEYTGRAVLHFR